MDPAALSEQSVAGTVRKRTLTGYLASVYLAGLHVPDDDVRVLITLVDEPTRSFLEKALALETGVVALTIEDRERILWTLDDARTDALAVAVAVAALMLALNQLA